MRVTVRFVDGEELEGEAQRVSLARGGFTLVGTGGNTRSIWVSTGAIKYVMLHPTRPQNLGDFDPRAALNLNKVVLHFLDGQVLHTYEDEVFASRPGGFTVRLWDPQNQQLVKALISGASLKGVFSVEEWDSRSEADRQAHADRDRDAAPGVTQTWVEQDALLDVGPALDPDRASPVHLAEPVLSDTETAAAEVEVPVAAEAAEAQVAPLTDFVIAAQARVVVVDAETTVGGDADDARPDAAEAAAVAEDAAAMAEVAAAVAEDAAAVAEEAAAIAAEAVRMPSLPLDTQVSESTAIGLVRGDAEERRATFYSGLMRRRSLAKSESPEAERHRQLRARISEVLGNLGPVRDEEDDDPTG
ncbi:MAG: hypothetical protein QOK05_2113 [Chloroflexota bacterium]|jgi:hypothetical protein|nr:hypothetical protein [Chloroflexota bacterium]